MKYLMGRRGFALKVMEKAVPEPGPGQALVRVFGCGVCGTDLHFLRVCDDWTALGHEISGEVAAVGSGVRAVAVGDRVVVELAQEALEDQALVPISAVDSRDRVWFVEDGIATPVEIDLTLRNDAYVAVPQEWAGKRVVLLPETAPLYPGCAVKEARAR